MGVNEKRIEGRGGRKVTRFFMYLMRWQLSTPVLWAVVWAMGVEWYGVVCANLIGACLFFWPDKMIFRRRQAQRGAVKACLPGKSPGMRVREIVALGGIEVKSYRDGMAAVCRKGE